MLSAPAAALELALVVAELLAPALDDADDDELLLLPHAAMADHCHQRHHDGEKDSPCLHVASRSETVRGE